MKSLIRPISIIAIVLFIIGIFLILYYIFFSFPDDIKTSLSVQNATDIEKVKGISLNLLWIVGSQLALALLIFILLSVEKRKTTGDNIIYVEKYIQKQDKSTEVANKQEDNYRERINSLTLHIQQLNRPLKEKFKYALEGLCKELEASIGAAFMTIRIEDKKYIEFIAGYAYQVPDSQLLRFEFGEGISGQVAKSGKAINISAVPQGYVTVLSGLGKATPNNMMVIPVKSGENVLGILEIASFKHFGEAEMSFANEIANAIVA
ncbi:MAG: GAF domain-containing protein [Thermoflexibacter sp.]|jgi:putative methionine-R-sulfoxide reductase with GAF domain|nr:GAF domain-containing protein [Thermoflexibacter sp.]